MLKTVKSQKNNSNKRSLKDSSEMTLACKNANKALRFKESTPEQLEQIRKMMEQETKRNQKITLGIASIILALIVYLAFF